ncbi:MAG: hypothetical protein RL264_372 [Bacteroidota bacterium]
MILVRLMYKFGFFIALLLILSACKSEKTALDKKPTHSIGYIKAFHEGVRLKLNGQTDAAIDQFKKCLAEDQKDDAVYFALSQLYLVKNDLENAAVNTKKAVDIDPNNFHYQSELAYMYSELGKFDASAQLFDKLSATNVHQVDLYLGAAENWTKAGKVTKAVESLSRMEKYMGASPEIAAEKFRLLVQAKDDAQAMKVMNEARLKYPDEPSLLANLVDFYMQRGRYEEGRNLLAELIKIDPQNGLAQLMYGELLVNLGKRQEGILALKKAVKLEGPSLEQKMKILLALMNDFRETDGMDELVNYMVQRYPKDARSHSIQGDFYFRNNDKTKAVAAYKNAVKSNSSLYPIWQQVLMIEYQEQQYDSLLVDGLKCIEVHPVQPFPYFVTGVAYNQKRNFDKAIELLNEGLNVVVNDATLEAESWGQLGEAYFGKKDIEKGKTNYEKAILKQPKSIYLKNNFAYQLLVNNTQLDRAEQLINDIKSEQLSGVRYSDVQGYLYFRKGNYKEARQVWEQAVQLDANDKVVLEHLGDVYFFLNEKDKAVEYWKKAKLAGSSNQKLGDKINNKTYYEPIY